MSEHEEHDRLNRTPPIDESLVINTRLRELEREQKEEKKRQLRFNKLTVIFTAGLLVANIIYDAITLYLARTAKISADAANMSAEAARKAAKVAEDQLFYSERPWVSANMQIVGPFTFGDKAAVLHLVVTLKNVGHTVATHVNDWEDAIPVPFASSWEPAGLHLKFSADGTFAETAATARNREGASSARRNAFRRSGAQRLIGSMPG